MATFLAQTIKFRSLLHQLNKNEFLKLMGKMFDVHQSHLIGTSLFNHFIHSTSNNNDNDLQILNSTISTIIQSRKLKPKQPPTINIELDQLPKAIIGHISSFLKQSHYFHLQQTNRSMFIGSNSPNMLTELNLISIDDYSSIKLRQFQSLKSLKININKFGEFTLPNNGQFIMNQLQELTLNNKHQNDCNIEPFMNQNCIKTESIKTLNFNCFGDVGNGNRFNTDKVWRLLTKFPNVEYLRLCNIFVRHRIDADKLHESYPDLKGLCVIGGNAQINNDFVNRFGNTLHCLFHSYTPSRHTDFSNIDFSKLQEIILKTPNAKTINDILKTGRNLQKVHLIPDGYGITSLSEQELKSVIPQILKCESLEYFGIEANDENCTSILKGIEIGLFETKKLHRNQLKIRVNALKNSHIDLKAMMWNIQRIIHCLIEERMSSIIKNFMFIFDLRMADDAFKEKLDGIEILNDLNDISSNIEVQADGLCFVITNKQCTIIDPLPVHENVTDLLTS